MHVFLHLAAAVLVRAGDDYGPAPDLDHLNPDLRAALKDWLKWLQDDIGFGGWRLDFVKGYGAKYVEEYIAATVGGEVRAAFWAGHCGHYFVEVVCAAPCMCRASVDSIS